MSVHNVEKHITFAIDSVSARSHSNWGLLTVDDYPTDLSVFLVSNYVKKDDRIHLFHTSKPPGSPCKPRNIGIRYARGRYIAFLDSDDMWLPNKLEEQLRMFEGGKTVIVYPNYEKISEERVWAERIVTAPLLVSYRSLLKGNMIGNLTRVYDVGKIGKVYCQDIYHEGYILWLSILRKGYIAKNTNTVHALHGVRKQSVSTNKLTVISWQWHIYRNAEKIGFFSTCYYFAHYAWYTLLENEK